MLTNLYRKVNIWKRGDLQGSSPWGDVIQSSGWEANLGKRLIFPWNERREKMVDVDEGQVLNLVAGIEEILYLLLFSQRSTGKICCSDWLGRRKGKEFGQSGEPEIITVAVGHVECVADIKGMHFQWHESGSCVGASAERSIPTVGV